MSEIEFLHAAQLSVLENAIAEEREEDSRVNAVCQAALRTKYDHFVESLLHKAKLESESYMERALKNLETNVEHENEKLREKFETQHAIEEATSSKLQSIISNLRKSWEDEELSRAKRLEDRLRGHYCVVLEHMEAQLQMALTLQDEVDKQWVKDVEMRNRQQMKMMNAFEKKCRRLYDTRLSEYVEKTDEQMMEYQTQLLQVGGTIAQERSRVESHKRRLKMACFQWKIEYQNDLDRKYQKLASALEVKYINEMKDILENNANAAYDSNSNNDNDNNDSGMTSISTKEMVSGLTDEFRELKVPLESQVTILMELLSKSSTNTNVSSIYDHTKQKLVSRGVITKKLDRKNFLSYKMDLLKKQAKNKQPLTMQQKLENQDIFKELSDLQVELDDLYEKYEIFYGEPYHTSNNNNSNNNNNNNIAGKINSSPTKLLNMGGSMSMQQNQKSPGGGMNVSKYGSPSQQRPR
jgi:hypothetical protein